MNAKGNIPQKIIAKDQVGSLIIFLFLKISKFNPQYT